MILLLLAINENYDVDGGDACYNDIDSFYITINEGADGQLKWEFGDEGVGAGWETGDGRKNS